MLLTRLFHSIESFYVRKNSGFTPRISYKTSRDSIHLQHIPIPHVFFRLFSFPITLGRQSTSTKQADTSRTCTCNIFVSTIRAVQLCAVSIDYECEEGKAYTYVEVMTVKERSEKERERENLLLIYIYEKKF